MAHPLLQPIIEIFNQTKAEIIRETGAMCLVSTSERGHTAYLECLRNPQDNGISLEISIATIAHEYKDLVIIGELGLSDGRPIDEKFIEQEIVKIPNDLSPDEIEQALSAVRQFVEQHLDLIITELRSPPRDYIPC